MALPTAQPAEVLRAWQKDNHYEEKLAASLAKILPPQHVSKATPLSSVIYKSFTTLKDLQTLGEEYSGIVQVDETYHNLSSQSSRVLSILLSNFGAVFTKKLLRSAENKVKGNKTFRPNVQSAFIIALRALSEMVPFIESIYRASCYIYGGPLQIGKMVTGIDYVQVRPAVATKYAHLRLLGVVTFIHAFVSCGQTLYSAKKNYDQLKDINVEVESDKACVACLEEMLQPCALQCGHIFCMQCCYGNLETCALCRTPFARNTVIPLMNYEPGR